jgi:hypothetical protein
VLNAKLPGPVSGQSGTAFVRPESITLTLNTDGLGTITSMAFLGSFVRVSVNVPYGNLVADLQVNVAAPFQVGDRVVATMESTHALIEVGEQM